jgi:hypothetical protein
MTVIKKPLVYVAGPYTHPDPVENTHKAIRAGIALQETGLCAIIIPHLSMLAHVVSPRPPSFWYELDLDQIAHADALYLLPGESWGADREVERAHELDIPVFEQHHELMTWLMDLTEDE